MKKGIVVFLSFFLATFVYAQLFKTIDVGKMQARVYDHGCYSEDVRDHAMCIYFRGSYVLMEEISQMWPGGILKNSGMFFGVRNWKDTTGYVWDAYVTGHACRKRALDIYQFSVPDEEGYYIRRYFRYPPTQVIVDGKTLTPPLMFGDEVAPEKILGGTADVMVESHVRLNVGVDAIQRVLAWSQPGHDDYIIWDWTFVNTGNVDKDPEIELPGQKLEGVYITRITEAMINGTGNNKVMATWAGTTENHDTRLSYPQDDDSLRIDYVTPLRARVSKDSYGLKPGSVNGTVLDGARFGGTAVLFAPKNTKVRQNHPIPNIALSNDPAQPSMHSSLITESSWIIWDFPVLENPPEDYVEAYELMVKGGFGISDNPPTPNDLLFREEVYAMDSLYDVYDSTASGGKTYYEQPLDRWGELDPLRGYPYAEDIKYLRFDQQCHLSIGPYDMDYGDTLRFVYAYVGGAISRKTSYLLGEAWAAGVATSYDWLANLDSATMVEELKKRDPIFNVYYPTGLSPKPTLNDIAKDLMVATGKDSLFNNGMNAQRNFNMNYEIPASPAPPSRFEVTSRSDMIKLEWSYEPGFDSDIAKFRIYRALGDYVYSKVGDKIVGDWQLIDSVSGSERLYEDKNITPGVDYFYSITAVGNNGAESGIFLTMTLAPARLKSIAASNLDSVRVVPNPLNIKAIGGYTEGGGYKIGFANLTDNCTITILTESGKLVRTIEHKGGGMEFWYVGNEYLITKADQRPVSGIYIAYIRDNETGQTVSRKFLIIR